jgi:hypothetical protein
MKSRRLLRDSRKGSRNTFTVGNGHHPGVTSGHGNSREAGGSRGRLVPAGGVRCRGSRATGRSGAVRPDKAPFISYMKGALLYSARPRCSSPGPTRRQTSTCQARIEAERARPSVIHRCQWLLLVQVGKVPVSGCLSPLNWARQRRPGNTARAASQSPRATQIPGRPSAWKHRTSAATGT